MTIPPAQVYWLVLPLAIAISLVWSASRHEAWGRIWTHALRLGAWILGVLAVATGVLLFINIWV